MPLFSLPHIEDNNNKGKKKQMKMSKWGDEEERETFDKSLANDPKMTKMT